MNRWKVYVSFNEASSDLPAGKHVGAGRLPILNEDILEQGWLSLNLDPPYEHLNRMLRAQLKEHVDYELVSGEMWQLVSSYSEHITVQRFMEKTADGKKVEVHYRRIPAAVVFNEYMRDIEKEYITAFQRVNLQLPQYRVLEPELLHHLSSRVKAYVKKAFGAIVSVVDFTIDDLKAWLSTEELS